MEFLVLMNKTRFLLYKTWFYFRVGQARLGNKAPRLRMPDCDCAIAAKAKLNAKP
jgi:hypothetical protein